MPRRRRPARSPSAPSAPARSHVRADGAPKKRYDSASDATSAAQLQWAINGAELSTYRCEICRGWHLARLE